MRQIYIDLTTDAARLPGGDFIGYIGEHNATELLISVPYKMIDESDYQVLVFQAGPFLFKSKHIDSDKSKKTYRDGNTIHTLLSKSLTKASPLSLQVEAYKTAEDGTVTLIGKTPLVPHLVLKKAPEGQSAFNYDGSFEDVEAAIDNAHKHINLDVLNGIEADENGNLLFNGELVESIKTYEKPSSLPLYAPEGAIAYAIHDDESPEREEIGFDEIQRTIAVRKDIPYKDFSILKEIVEGDEGTWMKDYEMYSGLSDSFNMYLFYMECIGSIFVLEPDAFDEWRIQYNKPTEKSRNYTKMYFYNPGEPFDFGKQLGLETPIIVPNGWSVYEQYYSNFEPYGTLDIGFHHSDAVSIRELNDSDFVLVPKVQTVIQSRDKTTAIEKELINNLFEVPQRIKSKGLYIFDNGSWMNLSECLKKQNYTVKGYFDLPMDAPDGSFGYVVGGSTIFNTVTASSENLVTFGRNIYFNPYPMFESRLLDVKYEVTYGSGTGSNYKPYGMALFLQTNVEGNYALVTVYNFEMSEYEYYIYSWLDQTIDVDGTGVLVDVSKGWSKCKMGETEMSVTHLDELTELPKIKTGYWLKGSNITIDGYPDARSFETDIISSNEFIETENSSGLAYKTEGYWMPLY